MKIVKQFFLICAMVIFSTALSAQDWYFLQLNEGASSASIHHAIKENQGFLAVKDQNTWLVKMEKSGFDNFIQERSEDLADWQPLGENNQNKPKQKKSGSALQKKALLFEEKSKSKGFVPEIQKDQSLPCGIETEATLGKQNEFDETSEEMRGSSAVAVFFLQNNGTNAPIARPWTVEKEEEVRINIMLNMAWWSERAAMYGVAKTFELFFYGHDTAFSEISHDPTIASPQLWRSEVMDRMGYENAGSNDREKMRAFANDLRDSAGTDWGFIAYMIDGAENYRSNAMLLGPSTNVTYQAGRAGLTFAHEVGHIFGLRDEYEERAVSVWDFEINGLINKNADFRNYLNAPCLMKNNRGFCAYNAVHFGWVDSVEYTQVVVEPADAKFEVEISDLDGVVNFPHRRLMQGSQNLPVGRGGELTLKALPESTVDFELYGQGSWEASGDDVLSLRIDSSNAQNQSRLNYQSTGQTADYQISHLYPERELPGRFMNDILVKDAGEVVFASRHGISIWKDEERTIIDRSTTFGAGHYQTEAIAYHKDDLFFATNNEILVYDLNSHTPTTIPVQIGNNRALQSFAIAGNADRIWSATEMGVVVVDRTNNQFEVMNQGNSDLLNDLVDKMVLAPNDQLWLGYASGRNNPNASGLQVMDIETGEFEDLSDEINQADVQQIRLLEGKIHVVTNNAIFIFSHNDKKLEKTITQADIFDRPGRNTIRDVALDNEGRVMLVALSGFAREQEDGSWLFISADDAPFPGANFSCMAFDTYEGIIYMGSMTDAGLTLAFKDEVTRNVSRSAHLVEGERFQVKAFPNPVSSGDVQIVLELSEATSMGWRLVNAQGQQLKAQAKTKVPAGKHQWGIAMENLPSGAYFLILEGPKHREVIKLLR